MIAPRIGSGRRTPAAVRRAADGVEIPPGFLRISALEGN